MEYLLEKINRLVLFFVIYTVLFLVFFGTLHYTLPFVLALAIAYILQKPTQYLIFNFKLKNSSASLITSFLFFTILIFVFSFTIGSLTTEAIQLAKNSQIYVSKNTSTIYDFVNSLQRYYVNLDPLIVNTIESNLSGFISKFGKFTVSTSSAVASSLLNILASIPSIIMIFFFTVLTTYFFTKDLSSAKAKILTFLPTENKNKLANIFHEAKRMLGNYLISYIFILFISFIETLIGFLFLKVKYALILSILAALFDILPIIGSAAIYIPLALFYFLSNNYFASFGILILYLLVSIMRQIIEPKIMSSSLGIHPVAALAAIFIGLTANGLSGMIFCMFLVVSYNILKKVNLL